MSDWTTIEEYSVDFNDIADPYFKGQVNTLVNQVANDVGFISDSHQEVDPHKDVRIDAARIDYFDDDVNVIETRYAAVVEIRIGEYWHAGFIASMGDDEFMYGEGHMLANDRNRLYDDSDFYEFIEEEYIQKALEQGDLHENEWFLFHNALVKGGVKHREAEELASEFHSYFGDDSSAIDWIDAGCFDPEVCDRLIQLRYEPGALPRSVYAELSGDDFSREDVEALLNP